MATKKKAAPKSYISAARKAGAFYASGAKKGRVMSKAVAISKKIKVPGFITPTMIKQGGFGSKAPAYGGGAGRLAKLGTSSKKKKAAKAKPGLSQRYRAKRKASGKKAYTRSAGKITWAEAANQSGAVYPRTYPKGHKLGGKPHPKAGRVMTKDDALKYQRPVIGYLSRDMIRGFYNQILTTGGSVTSSKAKIKKAYADLAKWNGEIREFRREHGSSWLRSPQSFKRSGKTPLGKAYKKGARRPDYKQKWEDTPAKFQSGGGQHLRVKFRKGRGPVVRVPLHRGFGPSGELVSLLEQGGFGGPIDAPGGKVKLNRGKKRKTSRRRKARRKNPAARTTSGRFKKKAGAKRRKNPKRRRKTKVRAWNPKRRKTARRRKTTAKANPRRRRKTKAKANPRRSYRRKKSVAKNPRRRRRRAPRRLSNPGAAQLAQLKSQAFWLTVAHVGIGMTGTAMLSGAIMNFAPIRRFVSGSGLGGKLSRFAICLGSAGLLSAVAFAGKNVKLIGQRGWINVLVGGAVYCTANLLGEIFNSPLIPSIGAGRSSASLEGYYDPLLAHGSYPGQYPGMGMVMSPEELVAGESMSSMGDWMELSGLGSSGGTPIPLEDLRGYPGQYGGGMNDWVEFNSDAGLVQAGWDPGTESF